MRRSPVSSLSTRERSRLPWCLLGALCIAGSAYAEPPAPPPYYAVKNVTVVTGAGDPLEKAIVLLADGLIEAVGKGIPIPADAWVVDGEGLTLYPGLVDSLTTLGLKKEEEDSGGAAGRPGGGLSPGGGGQTIRGPEDRPRTTPWAAAADILAEDGRIEKWRKAGFTSAVTGPEDGFFAGQAALINLGGGPSPNQTVVASPVAQRLNFTNPGRSRNYPSSLMGSLAYIKQVFSDTRHGTLAEASYAAAPLGHERPPYDRTLATLGANLAHGTPFLMPAHLGRDIDRALAMAGEYQIPAVIYGGQGAYTRVDALKNAGVPVLVSLNWPKEEKDRDPEADISLRTLFHRRMAPATPARLANAGVPLAFYSDGLATPSEIYKNVRAAIDAGLSNEQALAALSANPARIFSVADRLGTVEAGKIANLVLASDWPWAEGAEIKAVFVDGLKYEDHVSDEPSEPPAMDVSGVWALTINTPSGSKDVSLELTMAEDGKVTGETVSERGPTPLEEGRMSADLLRFKTTRTMGPRTLTSSWSLTVAGETLSGSFSAGPMSIEVAGERTSIPDKDEARSDDAEKKPAVSLDEMEAAMALYQGPAARMDAYALTHATVWTVAGETISDGTVLVRDGKIAGVGRDVKIPGGMKVIDAGDGHLIPGIIDAHSHIAIEGGGNEGSLAVTSMVSIGDVLNPDDIGIYRALAGGVTTVNVLHGSANPIGGQNQVIKLRWGGKAADLKFKGAPPGIKFALGENPKRSNFRAPGVPQRYPQTRMGVMDTIRQAFTEALAYRKEWQQYEAAAAARNGRERGPAPSPPRRDFKLEALVEVLAGERLVHSHCYRADEIVQLMRLAEDFGFQVATLQHVLEGYKVADEIAAHGAGASTFSDWWGYKMEAYDAIPYNAALMTRRGVLVSINSDSDEEMRHLNQEAAKAMKWGGLSELEAVKMVTLNPALQLHIADRVGSIEVGKDADLVLYDGNPLSLDSVVQKTFVDGDLYFDREADRVRQDSIDAIKAKLAPAEKKEKDTDGDSGTEDAVGEPPAKPSPEVIWQDQPYTCREVRS